MKKEQMPHRKKTTSTDVAQAVGCSQATVSNVMNNLPRVSEYLKRKVLEQARKMNYNPRCGKLQQVAIILPEQWHYRVDGYVPALLNALVYVLYQNGIRMEIVRESDFNSLQGQVIDGAISISWDPELSEKWFRSFQIPLVRINANPEISPKHDLLAHVTMDGRGSMKILLDKLYSLGHRRVFLLAPESREIEQRRARYQGFFDYLKSRRVHHPEQNCIFGMLANSFEQNLLLLKQAVSNGATALIAVDEGAARNALDLIGTLKLNVPKRISVVSWEQKNVLPYFKPPITGMAINYIQLSETSLRLLASLCHGEKVSDVYFPFQMIERESVGPVFHRRSKNRLAERIMEILSHGPETRDRIAAALEMKPYSGYFNRTILSLLKSGRITYGEKDPLSRHHYLQPV